MRPTRRLWAAVALAVALAALGALFARPILFAGTALIGAWIVALQYRFFWSLERTIRDLSVAQLPARTGVRTGESVPVTLDVTRDRGSRLALEVTAGIPTGATAAASLEVALDPSDSHASRAVDVTWPVAGRHRFREATVAAADDSFRETVSAGTTPTVAVEPRSPRTVHVGAGGDRIAAYGEHRGGQFGSGLELAEIREYVPGDEAKDIDWKATARLASPHVREYETETDRRTLLVVDHRPSLATGPRGETKLDYLREVALAIVASSRRLGDPIGLRAVDADGVTHRFESATTPTTYTRIRRCLLELEATPRSDAGLASTRPPETATATAAPAVDSPFRRRSRTTAVDVRRALAVLEGADDDFAEAVRPYYADRLGDREPVDSDPLYEAVRRAHGRRSGTLWTVIFTDDSHAMELREAVTLARQYGSEVTVMLAPTVLYELDGLADVDRAYERYVAFEDLRRDLDRMPGVTALEVGPQDRLSTILSAGRGGSAGGRA